MKRAKPEKSAKEEKKKEHHHMARPDESNKEERQVVGVKRRRKKTRSDQNEEAEARKKPRSDEVDEDQAEARSSKPNAQPAERGEPASYTESLVVKEVMSYMLSAPQSTCLSYLDAYSILGYPLGLRVAAQINQRTQSDADKLRQYRVNGINQSS